MSTFKKGTTTRLLLSESTFGTRLAIRIAKSSFEMTTPTELALLQIVDPTSQCSILQTYTALGSSEPTVTASHRMIVLASTATP